MKKVVMKLENAFYFFSILFVSCVYEPPQVFYEFKILNHTKEKMNIEYQSLMNPLVQNDSLATDSVLNVTIMDLRCYSDYYKDTLIHVFFKKLKLSSRKEIVIDPYKRSNWKEKVKLRSSDNCSGADVYYELVIQDADLR